MKARATNRDLAAILDSLPEMVCRFLPDGTLTYANQAYSRTLGLSGDTPYRPIVHPDDLDHVGRQIERLSPDAPEIVIENRVVLPSGEARWTRWINRGFFEDGALVEVQATGRDVTAQKLAEQELERSTADLRFLAEASAILVSSLDVEVMLQRLARLVVPALADTCTISILDPATGRFLRSAQANVDPELERAMRERSRTIDPEHLPPALKRLIDLILLGRPVLVPEVSDEQLAELVLDEEARARMQRQPPRSYLLVPFVARGHVIGGMSLASARTDSNRSYGDRDLALAQELAGHAAMAVDNARLYGEVQEQDRRKDAFLATLAHEIRNPLAAVQNALEVLRRRGEDPDTRNRALDVATRQVRHQVRMVDDLLDVSRLTRGVVTLRVERVALHEVVREVVETQLPFAERRRHTLKLGPLPPTWLEADPSRLQQIVSNLVDNAIKYTPEGGRIDVWTELDDASARIHVLDDGRGIPPDLRTHVFDPFVQETRTHESPHSGLGIGLTITRELVSLHDGTIEAREGRDGRGTEMIVTLHRAEGEARTQTSAGPEATDPMRILVVDDNQDAADMLAALLEGFGHEVIGVYDGQAAVEAFGRLKPELVFVDIGMPVMDGYATAQALREQPGGAEARLVALTGYTQEADVERALAAGFDRHEAKPIELEALERLLSWAREETRTGR